MRNKGVNLQHARQLPKRRARARHRQQTTSGVLIAARALRRHGSRARPSNYLGASAASAASASCLPYCVIYPGINWFCRAAAKLRFLSSLAARPANLLPDAENGTGCRVMMAVSRFEGRAHVRRPTYGLTHGGLIHHVAHPPSRARGRCWWLRQY